MVTETAVLCNPIDMVDQEAKPFIKLWTPSPKDTDAVCRAFEEVRSRHIRSAAHSFKPRAGLGADVLTPLDYERLPDLALDELRVLFTVVEETLVWPTQVSLVLGRLLPKKSKGDRAIG
eukprot:9470440-Pyramimonas_sp.AAC.1